VSVNSMLKMLSVIWMICVVDYPDADHEKILEHIGKLQLIIFSLR
jgi:hypothetical protein